MLYTNYPTIDYPFLDGKQKLAVDILKRFRISDVAKREIPYWEEYILQDEDTPEVLANILYQDASLSWLVLMVNSVINQIMTSTITLPINIQVKQSSSKSLVSIIKREILNQALLCIRKHQLVNCIKRK